MKLHNSTHWQTRDLRAILLRVAADELADTDRQRWQQRNLNVTVVYSRGHHSGCAWLKSTSMRLMLPKAVVHPVEFAWLCAHELAHIRGQRHDQMTGDVMHFTPSARARYAWATDYPIRRRETQTAQRPGDEQKHQHAIGRLALAVTRRKRAATIERKWQRRVRYYERKMAASKGGSA